MSFEVSITRNRSIAFEVVLYEADGSTGIVLQATDEVRFKMYRRDGATPDLDLDSAADSGNGSGITIDQLTSPATCTVTITQGDTSSLEPGAWDAEVSVVDDSDSDRIKTAEHGTVLVQQAGAGDIGLL